MFLQFGSMGVGQPTTLVLGHVWQGGLQKRILSSLTTWVVAPGGQTTNSLEMAGRYERWVDANMHKSATLFKWVTCKKSWIGSPEVSGTPVCI